ncbi:MAG: M3 family oligoendopeptidase [bacterium]|nr:M3 family oligoendopeptidase [bacterium]
MRNSVTSTAASRWDLSPFLNDPHIEERSCLGQLQRDMEHFIKHFAETKAAALTVSQLAEEILVLEKLSSQLTHWTSYALCRHSEDVHDENAQWLNSQIGEMASLYRQAEIACLAHLRKFNDASFAELKNDPRLSGLAYWLERWRYVSQHSMEPALEDLNAELSVSGFSAWERLYENVAGRLEFDYSDSQGRVRHASMNSKVSLLEDRDPAVRKTTLENSNLAWQKVGDVIAACLNNIAGYRLKLLQRRGIEHHLDNAVFESGLSRRTLQVMLDTAAEVRPMLRSYLQTKSKICGLPRLGFQDILAPVVSEGPGETYSWEQAQNLVLAAFNSFSSEFADFASLALERRWIDAEVRSGKSPGGFCTCSPEIEESRIFMTYRGNYGDVATLAHELGHAWHEWLLKGERQFSRLYPMTLAETASTFAERVLGDYMLNSAQLTRSQRAAMLTRRLDDAVTYLLNIPMRFIFEDRFYEERRAGEVSLRRLKELMVNTQIDVFGEAIDPQQLDPWFWASKGHFYITDISFYNFPYTFGYLFSLGVYARAQREGQRFLETYKQLLRRTGTDSCEGVAWQVLGADLETPGFWRESLDLVAQDWRELQSLI